MFALPELEEKTWERRPAKNAAGREGLGFFT
jgi:hypothetical protein